MLTALTLRLSLWIVYGIIQRDWVIVGSNPVGAALAGIVRPQMKSRTRAT
jgi:MtN3 and saliva related transmembrane protein